MGASSCSKPFVVQELVIASKDLLVKRAQKYHDHIASSNLKEANEYHAEH